MPRTGRTRLDYMPGSAAMQALRIAGEMFPDLRQQALLDKVVITGVSVLAHKPWHAPYLLGRNRDKWRLPDDLSRSDALE